MTDDDLLALHRALVEVPSLSREEDRLAAWLVDWLGGRGIAAERQGNNVFAVAGAGPVVALNSHLDTVPPVPGWTRPPYAAVREGERVFGLGSNDAKASVAAMVAAYVRTLPALADLGVRLLLALTAEEETGGRGAEALVALLAERDLGPDVAIVGEPTGLDVAVAQKGLLVLELREQGTACHAAHGRALGATNALRCLAWDLVALDGVELGPDHPLLGPVTLEPTLARGGTARNVVPGEATCVLDVRVNPATDTAALVEAMGQAVEGEVVVLSDRLRPVETDPAHPLVAAARRAAPEARLFGSRGLSDLVFFRCPAIKVGPGRTERSHTADEFVLESEILLGARFYEALVREVAADLAGAPAGGAAEGSGA